VTFRGKLAVVTAIGAAWRLGFLWATKTNQKLLLNDSLYYSIQAGLNSEGEWFKDALTGQPGAEHGMLTSLYLTPWSVGDGDNVFRQRFAITLVGIATVAVVGIAGRRLAARYATGRPHDADRVGLVAAAIAAAYPNLWINDSIVMSESIAMLLVAAALAVALGHHADPTVWSGVALGVLAGLGALTRSEIVLCIPAFAIASAAVTRRRGRAAWPAVAMLVAAVVTLLPWTLYNAGRFREQVLLSTNDGNTLLGANCDTTYYDDVGGWDIRCLGPLEQGGLGHAPGAPDASQRSKVRRTLALDYIEDHLDRLPVVALARLGRLLDVYGVASLVRLDVGEEKAEWAVWAGIACWYVLAALAIAGWATLRRRRVGTRWWLTVPLTTVLVTAVAFYGAHRIRAPAEPSVVILAAVAVVAIGERLAHSGRARDEA
jgi:4-amino-4-deoxy-L-arabinose transferase-like glycosyltransferase